MTTSEEESLREAVRQCEARLARMTDLVERARQELAQAESALRSRAEAELRSVLETLAPELGRSVIVLDRDDRPVVTSGETDPIADGAVIELAGVARRSAPASVRRASRVAVAVGATEQFVVVLERE